MKKSNFTGWQEVFRFSFIQGVKQKSFIVFIIISCLFLLLFGPIKNLITGGGDSEKLSKVTEFTIYDETGLNIDYSQSLPDSAFREIKIAVNPEQGYDAHVKALADSKKSTEVVAKITYEDEGYFQINFVKASNAAASKEECQEVANSFLTFFDQAKLTAVDVTDEQYAFINQPVHSEVIFTSEDGTAIESKEVESISETEYMILLAGIMIVMMVINIAGGTIATAIVTEKSTKVIEYLMINVRPMALIVGKILASLAQVLIQFGAMFVAYVLSLVLNVVINGLPKDGAILGEAQSILKSLPGLNGISVVIMLVIILAGILFFAIVAGLAGASVSKMEELAEGLKIYQFCLIGGSYLAIFLCIMQLAGKGNDALITVCSLIPLATPFIVPANLLLGKVSITIALISMVLMLVVTALLFNFTSKVYESMIFYNGNPMKLKDIIQVAKNRRGAGKEEK